LLPGSLLSLALKYTLLDGRLIDVRTLHKATEAEASSQLSRKSLAVIHAITLTTEPEENAPNERNQS